MQEKRFVERLTGTLSRMSFLIDFLINTIFFK